MDARVYNSAAPRERPLAGVASNAAAFAAISLGDMVSKLVVAAAPLAQTLTLRSLIVLAFLTPFFIAHRRRGGAIFATRHPWLHLARSILQFVSVLTFFVCLRELPLTTVTAIMFIAPSLVALAAAPLLGEKITRPQVVALALGFIGCLIILRPSGDAQTIPILIALFSAATWALSMVMLRMLTRTEHQTTILAWGNSFLFVCGGLFAFFDWRPLETNTLLLIVAIAGTQLVGQFFSMTAFRLARAATVAPVQYTQLLWATFFGSLMFGEWPTQSVWIGAACIVAGGLWLVRAERRRDILP